jgi:hypothetical protein
LHIEEDRAARKKPHKTFSYFLSTSQQEVSADIIPNLAVRDFYPKTERTKTKAARCIFFLMSFPFLYIFNSLHLLLLFTVCQVCLPVKGTAEIETGITEKFSWDQANIRQKLGLVLIHRKKISQIIKDYFYLPFSLLIILCFCKTAAALAESSATLPPFGFTEGHEWFFQISSQ